MDKLLKYANSLSKKYFSELLDIKGDELIFTTKVDEKILKELINELYLNFLLSSKQIYNYKFISEYKEIDEKNITLVVDEFNNKINLFYFALYPLLSKFFDKCVDYFSENGVMGIFFDMEKLNIKYWKLLLKKYHSIKIKEWKTQQKLLQEKNIPELENIISNYNNENNEIYKLLQENKDVIDLLLQ